MGFFSSIGKAFKKVFKGVKKVVKKIGSGIKKVASKVAKAYGKLGIVGQLGLMFVLPGIGQTLAGWGTSMAASSNALVSFAGQTLSAGVNFVSQVGNAFSSITEGVTGFIGDFAKATANKLGMGGVFPSVTESTFSDAFANLGTKVSEAGSSLMKGLTGDVSGNALFETAASKVAEEGLLNQGTLPGLEDKVAESLPELVAPTAEVGVTAQAATASTLVDPITGAISSAAPVTDVITGAVASPVDVAASTITAAAETPSLLDKAWTATKTAAADVYSSAVETITNPGKLVSEGIESGVKSSVTSAIRQATGVEQAPEYTQYSYATYVPEMATGSDIGMGGYGQFDPQSYVRSNFDSINAQPYGFNAAAVNSANVYKRLMGAYGYGVA